MYGLDNASGVNVMPKLAPVSSATPLWFTEGGAGLAASYPGQDWFNMVQAEMLAVLTKGGIKPEKGKLNQLAEAIGQIVGNAGFQPSGDYATSKALNDGLALKFDKTGGVVKGALTVESKSITVSSDNDYAGVNLNRASGGRIRLETLPVASQSIITITSTDSDGASASSVTIPSGFGSLVFKSYVDSEIGKKIDKSKLLQTTGTITDNAMSQSAVSSAILENKTQIENKIIGVNQSFVDVTNSRNKDVVYTNDTSKPIQCFIISKTTSQREGQRASVFIDGRLVIQNIYNSLHYSPSLFFIVPAGSTYKVIIDQDIYSWSEFR